MISAPGARRDPPALCHLFWPTLNDLHLFLLHGASSADRKAVYEGKKLIFDKGLATKLAIFATAGSYESPARGHDGLGP